MQPPSPQHPQGSRAGPPPLNNFPSSNSQGGFPPSLNPNRNNNNNNQASSNNNNQASSSNNNNNNNNRHGSGRLPLVESSGLMMTAPGPRGSGGPAGMPLGAPGGAGGGGAGTGGSMALRIGPRLRAEGLMVPPASDAATLRRQVAALQIDLEAHIDGEHRLQSINQELRERLELYMKQNHENVERAETELNILHEDMEQTLELQRRLAQRAQALEKEKKEMELTLQRRVEKFEAEKAALQTHLSSMNDEVREKQEVEAKVATLQAELTKAMAMKEQLEFKLLTVTEEATYLKSKQEEYSDEMHNLFLQEQRNEKINRVGKRSMARRFFQRLRDAVCEQCIERANDMIAEKHYSLKIAKLGLKSLRIATGRSSLIGRQARIHSKILLYDCWRAWRLVVVALRRGAQSRALQAKIRASHSLHSWVAYVIRARESARYAQIAIRHWAKRLLKKGFHAWKISIESSKLDDHEEQTLSNYARRHYKLLVERRVMSGWEDWLRSYARPQKRNLANVQAHINKMTMKQVMATWRCAIRVKWLTRMKFDQAKEQDRKWLRIRTMARLKAAVQEIYFEREIAERGHRFQKLRQGKFVVKNWKRYVKYNRHSKIQRQVAFRHYANTLGRKTLKRWKEILANLKLERRAVKEVNQCLLRASMVFWRDHHAYHMQKRKKMRLADVCIQRKEWKFARKCFSGWWDLVAWRRRIEHLDFLLSSRIQRKILVSSLHGWMHATFENLLTTNAKCHDELLETQAQFEEQRNQVSTVDVENLQLIDRLHSMSSEIAILKTTIDERTHEVNELHRALEDAAVFESSMRVEIEQHQMMVEEQRNENRMLQRRIQAKNAEDTVGEVHRTLEFQNMEQALQELRIQLSERTSQLDSYEKALKETAERLEGASDESQEKLTSAFEIAGSLRKLLEDRDNQFATLEGTSRRRELELGEVQRKLAVANCTLCETVENRDARIMELENMLSQKQSEVVEAHSQLQDLELAMDAKESQVRKLEYEIKLISEPHALKAKRFVSSLSSHTTTSPSTNTSSGDSMIPQHCTPPLQQSSPYMSQCPPSAPHSPYTKQRAMSMQQSQVRQSQSTFTSGSPRLGTLHLKESMRHVYAQAKHALRQGSSVTSDDGGLGTNSFGSAQEMQSPRSDHVVTTGATSSHPNQIVDPVLIPTTQSASDPSNVVAPRTSALYMHGQDTSQRDWEASFDLLATMRPTATNLGVTGPSYEDQNPSESSSMVCVTTDQGAVDSLHVEIQRLQARIMNRLRDPPLPNSQVSQARVDTTGESRIQPPPGPS